MNTKRILVIAFIAICFHSLKAKQSSKKNRSDIMKATEFMTEADRNFIRLASAAAHAQWNWQVNITQHNQKISDDADKAVTKYVKKMYDEARKFKWRTFKGKNSTLYRWFELVGKGISGVESEFYGGKEQSEEASAISKMSNMFNTVKICPYKGSIKKCSMTFDKDIVKIFASSRNPEELKHYWLEFRKETGEKYKDLFLKSIKEDNKKAKGFGYKNKAEHNVAKYEDKEFLQNMAKEMTKILPLFKQIHAYVRKKLRAFYKNENIQKDGPIPSHLLGNMYAQSWMNIFPIVKPYPKSGGLPNVTKAMIRKKMEPLDLFIMAERFFTSIGLKKMRPYFWKKSVMTKLNGREMDCHASAHDFFDGKDFRIKMCTQVNSEDLGVIHHEMGHIEYYMHYSHLPVVFRSSANPGFHEAIGDAITLSVLTPSYLRQVGLLKEGEIKKDEKSTINYLMEIALQYAVTPSYAYIIDYWRNQVYNGTVKIKELNEMYWKYRLRYQGVCPPALRTEKNFDIGAKYHIPAGVEYFRYFVANIVQFQIHKILCKEAGHKGPLHECNIFKNKKAGKAFASFLMQGRSKKWNQSLKVFSKNLFTTIDASAMLEYFKPLMNWLKKQNAKEYIGWKSKNPMSCAGKKYLDDYETIALMNSVVTNYSTAKSDMKNIRSGKLDQVTEKSNKLDHTKDEFPTLDVGRIHGLSSTLNKRLTTLVHLTFDPAGGSPAKLGRKAVAKNISGTTGTQETESETKVHGTKSTLRTDATSIKTSRKVGVSTILPEKTVSSEITKTKKITMKTVTPISTNSTMSVPGTAITTSKPSTEPISRMTNSTMSVPGTAITTSKHSTEPISRMTNSTMSVPGTAITTSKHSTEPISRTTQTVLTGSTAAVSKVVRQKLSGSSIASDFGATAITMIDSTASLSVTTTHSVASKMLVTRTATSSDLIKLDSGNEGIALAGFPPVSPGIENCSSGLSVVTNSETTSTPVRSSVAENVEGATILSGDSLATTDTSMAGAEVLTTVSLYSEPSENFEDKLLEFVKKMMMG